MRVQLIDGSGKFSGLSTDNIYTLKGNNLYHDVYHIGEITAEEAVKHFEILW